jgi:2-polyprenyl-3-methyl-5-hydroxy-6-metoxy-1,4-benzoquinol methylase
MLSWIMFVYKYLSTRIKGKIMGTSLASGKDQILEWFLKNEQNINTVVDIGAGSGTYIGLIKESNQCCNNANWIGIEAWQPYIQKFNLEDRYNKILNQDVRTIDWTQLGPDVVIAGDVLEHMSKQDAIVLVDQILKVSKTLIISIPIRHMPQDAINGNPFEIHVKDDWSHDEVMHTWPQYIKNHWRKSIKSKIGVYWLYSQL